MMERAYRDTHELVPPTETTDDKDQSTKGPADATPASPPKQRPSFSRAYLINKLNYINFQNGTIQVVLRHRRFDQTTTCAAIPLPCDGKRLACHWSDPEHAAPLLESHGFASLYVTDGRHALEVVPQILRMDGQGLELELPDECWEIANRREVRYACAQIPIQAIQNSMLFRGELLEFSTGALRITLKIAPPQTFQFLDPDKPLNLIVYDGNELVFTGDFTILKSDSGRHEREFVLKPVIKSIQRYNARVYRSRRIELKPAPNIVFQHPLTRQIVNLKVLDLSGSGLSVLEGVGHSLLLPGMMLNEVELLFADSLALRFKAQVLYRNPRDDDAGEVVNGLAIIDMASSDHLKLLALLHQAENQDTYINTRVELDALWDFFFESGFIYPKKYAYIQANKEKIKETYWKLYTQNPTIARHFIYQHQGRIMAHMGMVRLYENAWLIHHHAARKRSMVRAGLTVLNQIGCFTYDSHRLYSMHMKYLMCYYRPENNFPNSVFGGFSRYVNDRACCSQDDFAYFHLVPTEGDESDRRLPDEWTLAPSDENDMQELAHWYRYQNDGLMLDCLDLDPQVFASQELDEEYRQHGFAKKRQLLSLRRNNRIQACIAVHRTDIGLNLSDLTNCVKVLLIDKRHLSRRILEAALHLVFQTHALGPDMPILLHPAKFAEQKAIPVEKNYCLWILNTRYSDKYFGFLDRMFKLVRD